MAVFTPLNPQVLANLVLLHDVGELVSAEGMSRGRVNTTYRITTRTGHYVLRLSERGGFWDLVHEKDLLLHLAECRAELGGVQVPRLVRNVAGGYLFPMDGKFVCLFQTVPGRDLGVFEVSPEICAQVGRFLGRLHRCTRGVHLRRRHAFPPSRVRAWARQVPRHHPALADARTLLLQELAALDQPVGRLTPRGMIHGDLVVENARFQDGTLCGVLDFEEAGRGPLLTDVAVALNAWAWDRDHLDGARCRALVDGYAAQRPLTAGERRVLFAHVRLDAARVMARRVWTYELRAVPVGPGLHREYAPYQQRLEFLRGLGPRRFRELCGLAGEA